MLVLGLQLKLRETRTPLGDALVRYPGGIDALPLRLGINAEQIQCNRQVAGRLVLPRKRKDMLGSIQAGVSGSLFLTSWHTLVVPANSGERFLNIE